MSKSWPESLCRHLTLPVHPDTVRGTAQPTGSLRSSPAEGMSHNALSLNTWFNTHVVGGGGPGTWRKWDQSNGRDPGNVELRQIPVSQRYWTQEVMYVAWKACWSSLSEKGKMRPLCNPSERSRKSLPFTILDPQEELEILPINSLPFFLSQL